jgi:UDP-N-acetylglucosamine/UDP-N-acetylgalactosamine 4-epimerase
MPNAPQDAPKSNPHYDAVLQQLKDSPKRWLVTGCAGFIGSNLLETLLKHDQEVVGLDNFATGYQHNLDEVQSLVTETQWERFRFINDSITNLDACSEAVAGTDYVLHQAALGSVPRSIADPIATNESNVTGFLNVLMASRDANVKRFVYASSSSVYGDQPDLPKVEAKVGNTLSPYAVTKKVNELYAEQFAAHYGLECRGMRYFNVFGARQDPDGAYAAVIPRWIAALIKAQEVEIYGDGETSRDFCYIANVVQANLLAATQIEDSNLVQKTFNIAAGGRTTLNELHASLVKEMGKVNPGFRETNPVFRDFRCGDIRHSLANITAASEAFGYQPTHSIGDGLGEAMRWYVNSLE